MFQGLIRQQFQADKSFQDDRILLDYDTGLVQIKNYNFPASWDPLELNRNRA